MSHSTLAQLERGLQSNSLAEILPTISNCAKAIRENPFPLFVNGLLLRLAEVFQGDKIKKLEQSLNLLRLRIIKLLRECGSDLSVAFSSEEVVRRVMKVSHSNDYKSRSLTMLFLAAVAPVVFENKKNLAHRCFLVHYLLVEGLDCDEISELTSAIIATGSMGRLSYEFSSLVVEKIGDMVSQTQTDPNIKVRLMDDLSFFQENVAVTNHCMELGRNLLQDNPSQQIAVAVVGALTELAKRNGLVLTEQIDLILDELERVQQNTTLLTCYIANLLELADAPQHWTLEQVNKLQQFQSKIVNSKSERALILWLQCLNSLAKHVHGNTLSACGSHIIEFAYDENLNVRINFLEVMFSLLKNTEKTDLAWSVGPCIISIINQLTDRECTASMNERMKFYKMLVDFVKDGGSTAIDFDLNSTIRSLTKIDDSYAHVVFTKTLETLNALCECQPDVAESICDWSMELLNRSYEQAKGRLFCDVPSELYSLALLPFEKNTSRLKQLVNKVVVELEQTKNFWFAYKLTRHAFRYGHWNTIAVPLLEKLRGITTTIETSSFLSALYEIANAKLPKKKSMFQR
ncbi:Integrator complex subunit 7 [Aphelenchoides besseyi]|nr:Integrator complex subunit 7 [Aphelenchoides besseyi]